MTARVQRTSTLRIIVTRQTSDELGVEARSCCGATLLRAILSRPVEADCSPIRIFRVKAEALDVRTLHDQELLPKSPLS